jgi:Flp pilus assembly protein TadG
MRAAPRGQVLVIVAVLMVILLAFAGITVDLGRQNAERRHVQTAADAAALAACRALIDGESDSAAADAARTVAMINVEGSPADATATVAPDNARIFDDGHAGDPAYLRSGIIVSGTSVRVAISSTLQTGLARVLGITTLDTGAQARCQLAGGPAIPIVARRYVSPPGPGGGFTDSLATVATSGDGAVDSTNVATAVEPRPASRRQGRTSTCMDPVPRRRTTTRSAASSRWMSATSSRPRRGSTTTRSHPASPPTR